MRDRFIANLETHILNSKKKIFLISTLDNVSVWPPHLHSSRRVRRSLSFRGRSTSKSHLVRRGARRPRSGFGSADAPIPVPFHRVHHRLH